MALNYLLVTDSEAALEGSSKVFETVLIVTGHADELRTEIEEEDEDWLRLNGGKYGMLDRLRRIDMRSALQGRKRTRLTLVLAAVRLLITLNSS